MFNVECLMFNEDMKKVMFILVLGALMACLVPVRAQVTAAQEWQSTSTMQMSGSNYSAQVGAIGATTVEDMATTTSSSPAKVSGRQKTIGTNQDGGVTDEGSPVGDAVFPLLAFALVFCGVIALRRKRETRA